MTWNKYLCPRVSFPTQLLFSPARVSYLSSVSVMQASASTGSVLQKRELAPTPHSVKHKPIFDTLVNNLKRRNLLALGRNRPTQPGFLLSVGGHGQWLGNIFHLVSWHDSLALDKIKDGPLKHFWWVIACMQSTHTVDKEIQIMAAWRRVTAYSNRSLCSGLYSQQWRRPCGQHAASTTWKVMNGK